MANPETAPFAARRVTHSVNYLAHHAVALAENPDAPPAYFVGVALPDLLGASGEARVKAAHLAALSVPSPLALGAGLHLATDKRFHALLSFADAQKEAALLLRETAFSFAPRRVFFLAHIMVEIAFDGYLLQTRPDIARDFYARFADADLPAIVDETQHLTHASFPLLGLARTMEGFLRSRYLSRYDTGDGQAEAISRLCARVGLPAFDAPNDRTRLAAVMKAFEPRCKIWETDFLTSPLA